MEAAGFIDENSHRDNKAWAPIRVHCFERCGPLQLGYSPDLQRWLRHSNHDLLHLHCLWMHTSYLTSQWHRRSKRPYIVTPHGMLDPWALKNSGWKKRIAEFFYEKKMLRKASVIHAFHSKDVADIRAYGLRNPIAVIPNGVSLPKKKESKLAREKRILFLGRLHPKKGLAQLFHAWNLLPKERRIGWKLTIAGWDDGGHLSGLKNQVDSLGLQDCIEFIGPIFGDEKHDYLDRCAGFILPSISEGLPMTVLEAWAHEMPVLMTDMCNLPKGFEASAAIKIDSTPEGIAVGLNEFLQLSTDTRERIGQNGRLLVEQEFTWDKVSDEFASVYRWMINAGPKPDSVMTLDSGLGTQGIARSA